MSEERRFRAGGPFKVDGIWYRLIQGEKGPDDLRLDWYVPNGDSQKLAWRPVTLDHVFLIVDAIADNENYLFEWPAAGGDYVRRYVMKALKEGYRKAIYDLQMERDLKHHPELFEDA